MRHEEEQFLSGYHASPLGPATYELVCGDAIDLLGELEPRVIKLLATDIPYAEVNERPSQGVRQWDVGVRDQITFDITEFAELAYARTDGWVVMFCGWCQFSTLVEAFRNVGPSVRWLPLVKTNPSPVTAQTGIPSHEVCVIARKPGSRWYGAGYLSDLRCGSSRKKVDGYRVLKPARLMAELIRCMTLPGDLVVDPCMGVGSTGEAAIQFGRNFVGCDLDPRMFAAASGHLKGLRPCKTEQQLNRRYRPLS